MKIAIAKIRPNPNNPRHLIIQSMIDDLAASFAEVGQTTSIKVAVLTEEEKACGVPGATGDGESDGKGKSQPSHQPLGRKAYSESLDMNSPVQYPTGISNSAKEGEGDLTGQNPGFEYEVVDGMLRFMAARKLGWTEIEAEVMELDPKKRYRASVIGNLGKGFFWLDLYTSIEQLLTNVRPIERLSLP